MSDDVKRVLARIAVVIAASTLLITLIVLLHVFINTAVIVWL